MPEYDYQQRPQTDAYQSGWDRIWGDNPKKEQDKDDEQQDSETGNPE